MSSRNAVHRAFDAFGKGMGMEKKSGSWYHRGEDVVGVVNLQKSQYSLSYYVNVGFWMTDLGEERYPKCDACHVSMRLGGLIPSARRRIDELFDFEYLLADESREAEIRALFDGELRPLLDRSSAIAGLRGLYRQGRLAQSLITLGARAHLEAGGSE